MQQQQLPFDEPPQRSTAAELRDSAIQQVHEHNPDWSEIARRAIIAVAQRGIPFTTDDVFAFEPSLEDCPERRVLGAPLKALSTDGFLKGMGYVTSKRRKSHARPKRQWIIASQSS